MPHPLWRVWTDELPSECSPGCPIRNSSCKYYSLYTSIQTSKQKRTSQILPPLSGGAGNTGWQEQKMVLTDQRAIGHRGLNRLESWMYSVTWGTKSQCTLIGFKYIYYSHLHDFICTMFFLLQLFFMNAIFSNHHPQLYVMSTICFFFNKHTTTSLNVFNLGTSQVFVVLMDKNFSQPMSCGLNGEGGYCAVKTPGTGTDTGIEVVRC